MADENDLTQAIVDNATGPSQASGDSGSMQAHSLGDQIAADRYLKNSKALGSKSRGLTFSKFVPPGTVSRHRSC